MDICNILGNLETVIVIFTFSLCPLHSEVSHALGQQKCTFYPDLNVLLANNTPTEAAGLLCSLSVLLWLRGSYRTFPRFREEKKCTPALREDYMKLPLLCNQIYDSRL